MNLAIDLGHRKSQCSFINFTAKREEVMYENTNKRRCNRNEIPRTHVEAFVRSNSYLHTAIYDIYELYEEEVIRMYTPTIEKSIHSDDSVNEM